MKTESLQKKYQNATQIRGWEIQKGEIQVHCGL